MTLPLIIQISLNSCHGFTTCQQSVCKSTAPILHSFIDNAVTSMTKPYIVCHTTSQHKEPALVLLVHSSCTDILQLENHVIDMVPTASPFLSFVYCRYCRCLKVIPKKQSSSTLPTQATHTDCYVQCICRFHCHRHIMCMLFPTICLLLL